MWSRSYAAWVVVAAFFVGGVLAWLMHSAFYTPVQSLRGSLLRQDLSNYPLIAPLLACEAGTEEAFPEFAPLKAKLNTLINQKIQAGSVDSISVYLRGMRTGRWLEVNNDQTYAPASLLKVFVMMAYYKEADETDNPGLLQKEILFGAVNHPSETPGEPIPHLTPGQYYTVEQLIEQMIIYSDNDALDTLVNNFDSNTLAYFEKIFDDLNIPSPVTQNEQDLNYLSVSDYAMVFRVLHDATYLSERYSQRALDLLTRAHYKGALVAGVPGSITVAHKFGVQTVGTATSTQNELHDCGIVYYPQHPYLLCIMTRGKNFADLQSSIKEISQTSYVWLDQYFASQKPTSNNSTTRP